MKATLLHCVHVSQLSFHQCSFFSYLRPEPAEDWFVEVRWAPGKKAHGRVSPFSAIYHLISKIQPQPHICKCEREWKGVVGQEGCAAYLAQLSFTPTSQMLTWLRFHSAQSAGVYWFHVTLLLPFLYNLSLSEMSQLDSCSFLGFRRALSYKRCQCQLLVSQVSTSCNLGISLHTGSVLRENRLFWLYWLCGLYDLKAK